MSFSQHLSHRYLLTAALGLKICWTNFFFSGFAGISTCHPSPPFCHDIYLCLQLPVQAMSSNNQSGLGRSYTWVEKLEEYCRVSKLARPAFNILSDRRGGRTAWSSTVTISLNDGVSQTLQARFWYDGQHVNQSKEDAAEVAYRLLASKPLGGNNAGIGNTAAAGWPNSSPNGQW